MTAASSEFVLPAAALWSRELRRFVRQRSRVLGALGTPLVFWLLLGSGLGSSFRLPEGVEGASAMTYGEYFFPGSMGLILLFSAIFSTISVIEDRREGFMQGVLVSPASRAGVVLGKLLGSTTMAAGQCVLFYLLAPTVGIAISPASFLAVLGASALVGFGLSSLGLLIAWRMDSTQGFHAIMNLFLVPMWLLSGATFPSSGAHGWLAWIMAANPLTYGMAVMRRCVYLTEPGRVGDVPGLAASVFVTAACGAAAWWAVTRAATSTKRKRVSTRTARGDTRLRFVLVTASVLLPACRRDGPPRVELPIYGTVTEFNLTESAGAPFSRSNLLGRVSVVDFIFTRCAGPCPKMSAGLRDLQARLADAPGVQLISVTVDPDYDAPSVLTEYGNRYGATPGRWHFLTGEKEAIRALAVQGFKVGSVDDPILHSTRYILVDEQARIRGYYDSEEPDVLARLAADARALSAEARP